MQGLLPLMCALRGWCVSWTVHGTTCLCASADGRLAFGHSRISQTYEDSGRNRVVVIRRCFGRSSIVSHIGLHRLHVRILRRSSARDSPVGTCDPGSGYYLHIGVLVCCLYNPYQGHPYRVQRKWSRSVFRLMCHSFVIPMCCLFRPCHSRSCQIWEYCLQQVFGLMCLGIYVSGRWLGAARIEPVSVRRFQWWGPVASDNVRVYADRWTLVLWLAAFCDAGGAGLVAPPTSVRAHMHRCWRLRRLGGMYMDCVHLAGISWSFAAQVVTGAPNSGSFSGCCLFSLAATRSGILLVTQTINHGLPFSPVNYLFKMYLFHTINSICFQMLCYSRCVRHVCFGINGPITAQLSNGPWQRGGIAWSHLLLSFTFPYINWPITEGENMGTMCHISLSSWNVYGQVIRIHSPGLCLYRVCFVTSSSCAVAAWAYSPHARKAARAAVSATSPDDADVSSAPMPMSLRCPSGLFALFRPG